MSKRPPSTAGDVERLLRQAGVAAPPTPPRRRGTPRTRWGRFRRVVKWRLLWVLFCVAVALFVLLKLSTGQVGDTPGQPATARDPRFGVVEGFAKPRDATILGVGWERMVFWWKSLQPTGPDSWNNFATAHDTTINAELAAGRQIAGLLINTPAWAASNPSARDASPPKGLYLPYHDPNNYWGHFVGLIAKRYAGRIDNWIIWNEVNIPSGQFHTWAGSDADYARLVQVAYLAARAANPHARIILAGDPYWYDHGALFVKLLTLLTADHAHNASFDVVNLHLYSRPSDMAKIVAWYRATLTRFGLSKPIWIAETNAIPYDDPARSLPRGHFYASLDDQASFIVQAFAIDLAMGVQRIEVNRMVDGSDFTAGGEPFGLVRNDGSVRPAFFAYRTVVDLFSGVTGGTEHLDTTTGIYTVVLHKPGATLTVVWNQRPTAATARIAALGPTATVYDKFGQRSTVHARNGVFSLPLWPATGNTNSADPSDYVIGGSPLIVVQG
ncbi:MAG TPA: hypothetical protein VNL35_19140 [Chloroflexota bacterium]|nr:hypothetical protein [Chloroflexota bacterium]